MTFENVLLVEERKKVAEKVITCKLTLVIVNGVST